MNAADANRWVEDFLAEGEEDDAMFVAMLRSCLIDADAASAPGGSRPGRAPNKKRDPASRHLRLLQQYFGPDPIYDEGDYRNRFRMRQQLFQRIMEGVVATDSYFEQRPDATGKMGISTLLKVTAALRQLAYASAADAIDENLELSDTTAIKCLKRFCFAVIACFGGEYLRAPTIEELHGLLEQNARRGFVGMIGSVDCMHWQWRLCPTAHAGQYKGKEKKPTVVLEAVADYNLRIWHCNFGSPGSLNDINILDQSPLFNEMLQGKAPRIDFSIAGNRHYMPYLLADGIYPEWPVFAKPIECPRGKKQKPYSRAQEGCRKDVERCFGVLQARFRILDTPCRLWSVHAMSTVMHACVILHNMILEDERFDPDLTGHDYLFSGAAQPGGVPVFNISRPATMHQAPTVADLITNSFKLHNRREHFSLRDDLVTHLWEVRGLQE
ncbi:hypothetical protein PF008_g12096 [Phytophthora fragariae]|uniref:DDE Tnp4 domain-containing protein n=1 Tax=Phytophthora fragariae TaxID=53985 RepID=A0A6G0RQE2_9STRA|nr:hypothetical protein PF008_g12096 [Phytophthora fragariae]